jgi:hypothetical protein
MGYAKPTAARLIDQRARRRATQTLIEIHRDEFQRLYDLHRAEAEQEAEHLATAPEAVEHYRSEPVRLKPGARLAGQKVGDRIDVARCAHCVKHHDRNHVCPKCGAAPNHALTIRDDGHIDEIAVERAMSGDTVRLTTTERAEAARRMAAKGCSTEEICSKLRMNGTRLRQILDGVAS